ncbi:hypothetical protein B0H13DRAFT_1857544 [Mycena leptocephala]|nr:hypothetical protein B0H13DRAFT_1857544 [Mycena leptocephala]
MPALALADLLNPTDATGRHVQADMRAGLVDIRPQLRKLVSLAPGAQRAPADIQQTIMDVALFLQQQHVPTEPAPRPADQGPAPPPQIETLVSLNTRTTLSVLYRHPINAVVEYPETGAQKPVGHLFQLDPEDWQPPELNIAYSRGAPHGQSLPSRPVYLPLMVDRSGEEVPCIESHSTCHGVKVCPQSDLDSLSEPHTHATREAVQERLQRDRDERMQYVSPLKDTFCRTSAYLAALRKLGCCRPLVEATRLSPTEAETREATELYMQQVQRGYRPKEGICEGRLVFEYDDRDRAVIR